MKWMRRYGENIRIIILVLLSLIGAGFLVLLTRDKSLPPLSVGNKNIPSTATSLQPLTTKVFVSYSGSYSAKLSVFGDYCTIDIQDKTGIIKNFSNNTYIVPCGFSEMGGFWVANFFGWVGDSKLLVETEPGTYHILDMSKSKEKEYTYNSNQWVLRKVSKDAEYFLFEAKQDKQSQKNSSFAVFKFQEKAPTLELKEVKTPYASTYYDNVNNGFLIYWREDKYEDSKYLVRNIFRFVYLNTLSVKDVLATPYIGVLGRGCYPDADITPLKGELLFKHSCFVFPQEMYNENGKIHIKI